MFANRKTLGLFALAAIAATGIGAAPAMAGDYRGGRGDRCGRDVVVYRAPAARCAPRSNVAVSLGFYANSGRDYRDHRRGYSDHRRHQHWRRDRGRYGCR